MQLCMQLCGPTVVGYCVLSRVSGRSTSETGPGWGCGSLASISDDKHAEAPHPMVLPLLLVLGAGVMGRDLWK
jgi:hypothetical protein